MLTDVLLPETGYQDLTRSADEQLCADSVLRIMRGETLFETCDQANFYGSMTAPCVSTRWLGWKPGACRICDGWRLRRHGISRTARQHRACDRRCRCHGAAPSWA